MSSLSGALSGSVGDAEARAVVGGLEPPPFLLVPSSPNPFLPLSLSPSLPPSLALPPPAALKEAAAAAAFLAASRISRAVAAVGVHVAEGKWLAAGWQVQRGAHSRRLQASIEPSTKH